MKEYIKASLNQPSNKEYFLYHIPIKVVHPFTTYINLDRIIKTLENLIPQILFYDVEILYVAYIKDFIRNGRTFNAMYENGAIYISPDQDNEKDLLDDIVHETAHSLENKHQKIIYGGSDLEREFLAKRQTLYHLLEDKRIDKKMWINPRYSAKFDEYLYNTVGYDKLRIVSSGLFYSPYAITSLREYWANGFENYILGDKQLLKDLSPVLYNKLVLLFEEAKIRRI